MNIRGRIYWFLGWERLPNNVIAKVTPRPDADVLDVRWGNDHVRITHEHDCEG